jgi:hypothetical protein
MIAIVTLTYDYSIAVPVAKLSAVLAALTEYQRVDYKYIDGREVYFATEPRAPRVTLINALDPVPVKTDEE